MGKFAREQEAKRSAAALAPCEAGSQKAAAGWTRQAALDKAHAIVRMWLEVKDGTPQEQRDRLVEDITDAILVAAAQPQRESEGLAKFKGLAKEFRREASHWKKLDTSIAKARQDAFNECASDIEAAVKALEHGRESEQPEQALREALKSSMVALDDWLNIHASDHCDEQRVKEAHQRVNEHGTIHYIGTVQDRNRAALSPQTDSQEPR